jgi:ABC-2 type transport system permease protein
MNNTGVIFKRTLWDSRIGILAWGSGLGILALIEILMFPTIREAFSSIADLLANPLYKAFLGEAADAASFTTPAGFIAMYMLAFVPLYMAVYAVILGLGVTAGEEERGTIDILLGTPIPRWQIIVEKFAALVVILGLILLMNGVIAAIGVLITPEMQGMTLMRLLEGTIAMLPVTLVMAAFALLCATVLPSRNLAASVTGAVIIASYFVTNLSTIAEAALGVVKQFSFYTYYSPLQIMQEGIVWSEFFILLVVSVVLVGLSVVAFQRRDLAM